MNRARTVALVLAAVVALPVILAIETAPLLPPNGAPDATQVRAGQANYRRLRDALAGPPPSAQVRFTDADARAVVSLAGKALRFRRVDAGVAEDHAGAAASMALPFGLWLNARVDAWPSGGFPKLTAKLGDLPIPAFLTRFGLEAVAQLLRWRGHELPQLADLVRGFDVADGALKLTIKSPVLGTGIADSLVGIASDPADGARTATIYCALVAAETATPQCDIALHLMRAMAMARPATPAAAVAENRAALVAVAMMAVGPRAGRLAIDAGRRVAACRQRPGQPMLAGRADLAKHWSLSAALGATVGDDVSEAMGNWKELSDSLPGGSGFSLVDLAADRAGLAVGGAAVDAERALAFRGEMAAATNATLLPLDATGLAEGMTNDQFKQRYGTIESADYRAATAGIDALLHRRGVLGSR
ncbi:MAG: hypothetical protein ACOYKQ_10720 [Polymorphobacter sp.]